MTEQARSGRLMLIRNEVETLVERKHLTYAQVEIQADTMFDRTNVRVMHPNGVWAQSEVDNDKLTGGFEDFAVEVQHVLVEMDSKLDWLRDLLDLAEKKQEYERDQAVVRESGESVKRRLRLSGTGHIEDIPEDMPNLQKLADTAPALPEMPQ